MTNRLFRIGIALCVLLTMGRVAWAQTPAPATQLTVPFSDPSRPGTVRVNIMSGSVTVKPGTGREVQVTVAPGERDAARDLEREAARQAERRARPRQNDDTPSTDGLRRLTQPAGVTADEANNVVQITSPAWTASNLVIQVPAATSLEVRAVNGGEVSVEGLAGSIDVNNVNGSIRITDASGPVIAHATNGRVVATLKQVAAGKPMSFTSFNGNVDVTLPAASKANLKLRSDRGDVYTDFDVQTSVRTPGASPAPPTPPTPPAPPRRSDRSRPVPPDAPDTDRARRRVELDRSIYGSINGGGPDFELRTFNGNIYLRKGKG